MAPTLPSFNPARLRSYIFRLPLFTRIVLLLIVIFWILELQSAWNVVQWGALYPNEVNLGTSKNNVPPETSLEVGPRRFLDPVANIMSCHSVQDQHISSHSSRILSCLPKRNYPSASAGEIRSRKWDTIEWSHVCRTYIPL